jgi:hypothetical protein
MRLIGNIGEVDIAKGNNQGLQESCLALSTFLLCGVIPGGLAGLLESYKHSQPFCSFSDGQTRPHFTMSNTAERGQHAQLPITAGVGPRSERDSARGEGRRELH